MTSERVSDGNDTDIVVGPREQLFHLIAEASEIEHTLMCSYLYAAFSLKTGVQAGLNEREAAAVMQWRKTVLSVATEEMVHLLLMANMAIALGGRPHFSRPNFPVAAGYFPSGVTVRLTPFSRETLDHFIYLERPQGVERADGEGFAPEQEYEREQAHVGLMPSLQDYATVGRLYEALKLNLESCAKRVGEAALFVGPIGAQVASGVVQLEGVRVIVDLESALQAIATIVEQGEGSPADREDSHYHRFRRIQTEYAELLASNPGFEPAWPAASDPVFRRPPESQEMVFVDHPVAARVLDFANAVYGTLLRFLVQAFGRSDQQRTLQKFFVDAAIELMHVLSRCSAVLVTMPASTSRAGIHAGMTFTMLRGVEPMFAGPAEQQLTAERLHELAEGAGRIAGLSSALSGLPDVLVTLERKWRSEWAQQPKAIPHS